MGGFIFYFVVFSRGHHSPKIRNYARPNIGLKKFDGIKESKQFQNDIGPTFIFGFEFKVMKVAINSMEFSLHYS